MYVETKRGGEPQVNETELWRQQLLDAADYLEAHGWCRGMLYDYQGRSCIWGAMWWAIKRYDDAFRNGLFSYDCLPPPLLDLSARVERYLAQRPNKRNKRLRLAPGYNLARWNDARSRRKVQVLKALRGAARA